MDAIENLKAIDWFYVFCAIVLFLVACKFLISLWEWFATKYGLETAKMRQRREDHELLVATAESLEELQERHAADEHRLEDFLETFIEETRRKSAELHDSVMEQYNNNLKYRDVSKGIREDFAHSIKSLADEQAERDKKIEKLTHMVLDKEIDDTRWKLLDFASALSSGRKYNQEAFDHIFRMYEKYERILEENNMENGLVTESMKYVNEAYREHLKNGNFN